MKRDCFYEGLNPKYQWMLAHKVDGEHTVRYSNLLLAAQKVEWWAETRDPLLPKTSSTVGLNITHSQTSGNLFLSQKVKGSHNFNARSATLESNGVTEDSDTKGEEVEYSDREDPKTSSGEKGAEQLLGYIIHLANSVKLHQKKNQNYFRCGSPDHLVKDCPKEATSLRN